MRYFPSLFCSFSLLFSLAVGLALSSLSYADEVSNNTNSRVKTSAEYELNQLLVELTQVKLSKAIATLTKLEAFGSNSKNAPSNAAILPIFETLLAGKLYYVKANTQIISVIKTGNQTVFRDMLTFEELPAYAKKAIKKIKVNNKLRVYLRGALARIQLFSSQSEQRYAAVLNLLGQLNSDTIKLLQQQLLNEADGDVVEIIQVALALWTASDKTKTNAERIVVIRVLGERLEKPVRNGLARISSELKSVAPDTTISDTTISGTVKTPVTNTDLQLALDKALANIEHKTNRFALVNQLFFGLSLGSVLLLASIGLAITFGVMGVINMAHGEMIMLGAYTTYVVQLLMPNHIDYSIWVAIPAAFLVSGLVGVIIERGVIRHLHGRPLETLLATFGISLILQQLVRSVFSPLNRQVYTPSWMSGSLDINPVLSLTLNRLYILAFALLVFTALVILLKKTSLGLNVRAVSQNRDMAKSMGVKTNWVDAMTFGLGSGIAGIAGVALSQLTNVGPNLGQTYIIDSFMVVVFGGVGNLLGTLVAAFSLGIATKFLEPITGAVLAAILVLVFIILFIQKRPKGLFPQKGRAAE